MFSKKFLVPSFFLLSFSVFSLIGCKENYSYEMYSVSNSTEHIDANFTYPIFKSKSLNDINEILNEEVRSFYEMSDSYKDYWDEMEKEYTEAGLPVPDLSYNEECAVHFSDNYISILATISDYTGGAHGNVVYSSLCYDTKTKQFVDLETVSGKSLEQIQAYCKKDIKEKVYNNSDDDSEMWLSEDLNLKVFTIDDGKITVLFSPYEAGPWALGTITVDLN